MSYALYIGRNHSATGHAWLAGYGDEPSSHWLEILPAADHDADTEIVVGVGPEAKMPGLRGTIPQVPHTLRNMRVSYSHYLGVPAPITNGGLNEKGVAVRDVWSTSRPELIAMTPKDQRGPNYSDLAKIALERAETARQAVEICGALIAAHGESSYGGNSHLFADENEAWVMIQFAGGKGLWVAERLGPDAIRASRPGYVLDVPVEQTAHPDFLWSGNFTEVARDMGWWAGGPFDANAIYGDGKGRWAGIDWIEAEMRARSGKIGLADMIWAIRISRLTGDTAGYGQVVPLKAPRDEYLRVMWHAAIGAVAAPFAPVWLGQSHVPPEFGPHRYLTEGEAHRFMDMRKAVSGGRDTVSTVPQAAEARRSAVYEAKRLLYLMQHTGDAALARVTACLEAREGALAARAQQAMEIAETLLAAGQKEAALAALGYFSTTELMAGHRLVMALAIGLEAELTAAGDLENSSDPVGFAQIW